jgi:membrane-associated protein
MSVPETESAQPTDGAAGAAATPPGQEGTASGAATAPGKEGAASGAATLPGKEGAAGGAATAPGKADRWNDPRLPWLGKPRVADILCWAGIVLSGVFFWALLPLRVSLVGTHPVVAELLNGSTESIISAAAFARVGHGTLAVVLLAAIPGLMKFDILYWWAGRLWGERFIVALPGSRRAAKYLERVQRAGPRFTWPAMVLSSFLPVPRAIIFVIVGWAGMRLVTFFVLDAISVLLWAGLLAGLGYTLGHQAVVAAKTVSHYSLWFTIGLVVLTVLLTLRAQRRAAAAPDGPHGG